MRRLKDDIKNVDLWHKCSTRPVALTATYNTAGMEYFNRYDRTCTTASDDTPIVVQDDVDSYRTYSVEDFKERFVCSNGLPITDFAMNALLSGGCLQVIPAHEVGIWFMQALRSVYGNYYMYNVNAPDRNRGRGDYLMCRDGTESPDIRSMRVVHYTEFNKYYLEDRVYV